MTSSSLQDLADRLHEIRVLADQDPVRSGDISNSALSGAVNRACIVLLSAHLEGFLEDLATETLDALVGNAAVVDRLPLLLRAVHAEEHLRLLEPIKDRNARAPRIERLFTDEAALWAAGCEVRAEMIRYKAVCGEMSNAGSKEVRQFLEMVGVDIRIHLAIEGRLDLLGKVDGLVGRRNAIAHGEVTALATHADVDGYVLDLEDLARECDVATANAIKDICHLATLPW